MSLTLPPLPYALDALEPHVSRRTLAEHHGHHHAAYVAKARAMIQETPLESAPLAEIVVRSAGRDSRLFNAAAQAWNHDFFWRSMRPGGGGEARGALREVIEASFGTHAAFNQQFVTTAADLFGSGWVWLVLDAGELRITSTANAATPLISNTTPILTLDVWEHAYYLDYQHRRLDYIAAFLAHLANWEFANQRFGVAARAMHEAPIVGSSRQAGGTS